MGSVSDSLGMGSSMASSTPAPSGLGEPVWDIATLYPPQGSWTEEQYLELTERANRLVEFDNGSIEILPMPTIEHQMIVRLLFRLLDRFVSSRELGEVLFSPLPTWIDEKKYKEPDILFATASRHAKSEKYYRGVDLAVEVVSEDNRSHIRDHVEKRELYAQAGIGEYWIVDPQEQRVIVLTLDGDAYAEHANLIRSGTAASKLLDGFSVDIAEVFAAGKKR